MANEAAVGFAFDPSGIVAGAQKGVAAIESLNARVKMASNVALGYLGMRGIGAALPELGKTASIAGDIIQRNLFWPLRQELAPLLNKFLAWVRDSRGMFVRWGGYLVGVFRIIKGVIEGIWDFMKRLGQSFNKFIENVFGKSTRTIGQTMNLLLGKIAIVIAFLMTALEPLADAFGKIFGFIFVGIKRFFEGLGSMIAEIIEEVSGVAKAFSELVDEIFGAGDGAKVFGDIMFIIGKTIGHVFKIVLYLLKTAIGGIKDLIKWFKETFNYIASAKSIPEGVLRTIESLFTGIGRAAKWVVEALAGLFDNLAKWADDVGLKWLGDFFRGLAQYFRDLADKISITVSALKEFFQLIGEITGISDAKVVGGKSTGDRLKDLSYKAFASDPMMAQGMKQAREEAYREAKAKGIRWEDSEFRKNLPDVLNQQLDEKFGKVEMTYNVNLNVTEGNAKQAGQNFNRGINADARKAVIDKRTATGR